MKSLLTSCLLATAVLGLGVGAAQAHPRLMWAAPAAQGRFPAPREIRLNFSETLIARFSKLALSDTRGRAVNLGPSALSPDRKQLFAPVPGRLAPGAYKVTWRAVSTDTHKVNGAYGFSVAP